MKKTVFKKIYDHPDREEIINKLILKISEQDIHDWLKAKYSAVSESKFVISKTMLKSFSNDYLDVYKTIQEDIIKTKSNELSMDEKLNLAVRNNSTYKNRMIELANNELDIKKMIINLATAIETRVGQIFDQIQSDPTLINTKIERLWIEMADKLGLILEKYHKFTTIPMESSVTNNNITLQIVDKHIVVFHDVIKDILSNMDLDSSMRFMELFNEKMSKLKAPNDNIIPTESKLAEVKLLNEKIQKTLDE